MAESLEVCEVLEKTYEVLSKRANKIVTFSEELQCEVGNDSDWHRTRTGCMLYKEAQVIVFGEKEWALAFSKKTAGYPAERFNSDLSAFEIEGRNGLEEEITDALNHSSYFKNSLLIGVSNGGYIATDKRSRFSKKMFGILDKNINGYISKEIEYDNSVLSVAAFGGGRMEGVCIQQILYKLDLVEFLSKTIGDILISKR